MFSFLHNSIKKEGGRRERPARKRIILTPLVIVLIAVLVVPVVFAAGAAAYDYTEYPPLHHFFRGEYDEVLAPNFPYAFTFGEELTEDMDMIPLRFSDDIRSGHIASGPARYAGHRFVFDISEDPASIGQISILHEGFGTLGHTLYVWNNSSTTWEQLDTTAVDIPDQTLTGTVAGSFADYITGGELSVLVLGNDPIIFYDIYTDYVRVDVSAAQPPAPSVGVWWQRPEVDTVGVADISDSTATFSGDLLAMGSAKKVKVYFRYGVTRDAVLYPAWAGGDITQAQLLYAPGEFNADISDLSPETKYYFCAYALADSSCYGEIMTFTTGHKLDINMMGQTTSGVSSNNGQLTEPLNVTSGDGTFELNIPAGTTALDKDGNPLQNINISVSTDVPDPPPGANIIGFVYDCQPAGATFDPPITLTMHYDPANLPEGVTEDSLSIAFWDGTQWVILEGIVDTVNHTVTVQISHFSDFAMMCELPATTPLSAGSSTSGSSTSSSSTAPGEEKPSPAPARPAVTPAASGDTTTSPDAATSPDDATPPAPAVATAPVPASPEPGSFNWWWLVAIVIGAAIIGWVAFRFAKRRD